jgi:hypothetical protein
MKRNDGVVTRSFDALFLGLVWVVSFAAVPLHAARVWRLRAEAARAAASGQQAARSSRTYQQALSIVSPHTVEH